MNRKGNLESEGERQGRRYITSNRLSVWGGRSRERYRGKKETKREYQVERKEKKRE